MSCVFWFFLNASSHLCLHFFFFFQFIDISDSSPTWWWSLVCLWSQSTYCDRQDLSETFHYKDWKNTYGTGEKLAVGPGTESAKLRAESLITLVPIHISTVISIPSWEPPSPPSPPCSPFRAQLDLPAPRSPSATAPALCRSRTPPTGWRSQTCRPRIERSLGSRGSRFRPHPQIARRKQSGAWCHLCTGGQSGVGRCGEAVPLSAAPAEIIKLFPLTSFPGRRNNNNNNEHFFCA